MKFKKFMLKQKKRSQKHFKYSHTNERGKKKLTKTLGKDKKYKKKSWRLPMDHTQAVNRKRLISKIKFK